MIEFVTLKNRTGMEVTVSNWGARITSIMFPTKHGVKEMLLTYQNPEDYLTDEFYLGATCGRVSNRISKAQFQLNGQVYRLNSNDNGHCLHGGENNLSKKFWHFDEDNSLNSSVRMSVDSPHLEEGFPGNVHISVTYELTDNNELRMQYHATTDMVTPINLTNHSYFNLGEEHCKELKVQINANGYLEVDEENIPTGDILPLSEYLDFREPISITQKDSCKSFRQNYDHCYVSKYSNQISAIISSVKNNIMMVMTTNQPSVQFYSGNFLNKVFRPHQGLCLEAQSYIDAVNHENFPCTLITPDSSYSKYINFKFVSMNVNPTSFES